MCDRRPNDREALQHQAPLAQSKIDRSLKHVPGYLVPKAMLKNPHSAIGQARSALGGRGANPNTTLPSLCQDGLICLRVVPSR